jgi:hypothetical protein
VPTLAVPDRTPVAEHIAEEIPESGPQYSEEIRVGAVPDWDSPKLADPVEVVVAETHQTTFQEAFRSLADPVQSSVAMRQYECQNRTGNRIDCPVHSSSRNWDI